MDDWFPALIVTGIAAAFAWQLFRAHITREICIPIKFLSYEDRALDQNPSDFWAMVVANGFGFVIALAAAIYLWMNVL